MNQPKWHPGRLLEMSGFYWQTCTLHAGVKLDIFTTIGDQALTAGAVAQASGLDARATEMLLNALSAMTLLNKQGDRFRNTDAAAFLRKDSPRYIGFMILHHQNLVASWSRLDEAVRTGHAVRDQISQQGDEARENFLMGMFNLASTLAPQLVPEIDMTGRKRLLDMGGGPGTYAIHFCLHNPHLNASVFDLPTTRPFAERTIERFDLNERINFTAGNYLEDELPKGYDVIWMSHILHGENPETSRMLIKKAVSALNPGGMIIIHDFILNDTQDGPLFPALFSLNMLINTSGGQAYSAAQIKEMLASAGVKNVRRISVQTPNDSGLVIGEISS